METSLSSIQLTVLCRLQTLGKMVVQNKKENG